MSDLREIALNCLLEIVEKKASFNTSSLKTEKEDDMAFVTMLVLTALRKLVYVRQILKKLVAKKLGKQNMEAQCALILGAVELLYMKTPDYAVINSYVGLIKKKNNRYLAGFVNAVLRRIAKEKEIFIAADAKEFFPQSFRSLLRQSYSSKEVDDIEKFSQIQPCLDVTCKNENSKIKTCGTQLPLGTIRIATKGKISNLPDYDVGEWWIQDFSSALPVKMLNDLKGKKVLDVCAAPGGKTAQLIAGGAKVDCLDVDSDRLEILKKNMIRLKMKPENIVCKDGLDFLEKTEEKYDVVLLDAPCSATGTLRRHPEIVHFKTLKDVEKQVVLQKEFLEKSIRVLKKNGILLYCTCSLCKQEGEEMICNFMENHESFEIVNLDDNIPKELKKIVTKEGFIRVLPQYLQKFGGADGFFVACLRKVA